MLRTNRLSCSTTSTAQRGSTAIYGERQVTYQSGTKVVSSSYGYTNATPVYSTRQVEYISGYKTTSTAQEGSTPIYESKTVQYVYGYTTTATATSRSGDQTVLRSVAKYAIADITIDFDLAQILAAPGGEDEADAW